MHFKVKNIYYVIKKSLLQYIKIIILIFKLNALFNLNEQLSRLTFNIKKRFNKRKIMLKLNILLLFVLNNLIKNAFAH